MTGLCPDGCIRLAHSYARKRPAEAELLQDFSALLAAGAPETVVVPKIQRIKLQNKLEHVERLFRPVVRALALFTVRMASYRCL